MEKAGLPSGGSDCSKELGRTRPLGNGHSSRQGMDFFGGGISCRCVGLPMDVSHPGKVSILMVNI